MVGEEFPIGIMVFTRRTQMGLSQYKLAERAGISRGHLIAIEQGKAKDLKMSTVNKLANALGIHPAAFLNQNR